MSDHNSWNPWPICLKSNSVDSWECSLLGFKSIVGRIFISRQSWVSKLVYWNVFIYKNCYLSICVWIWGLKGKREEVLGQKICFLKMDEIFLIWLISIFLGTHFIWTNLVVKCAFYLYNSVSICLLLWNNNGNIIPTIKF